MTLIPAEVFHVGEYIHDEMLEREMSSTMLSQASGVSVERWNRLIAGTAGLLGSEAEALERIGWGSAVMWMTLHRKWKQAQR